uniref:UDP-glycosyltransferase 75C1-like n=1 Tax=Erigeron canadensis TaxID=72917 RepID=UPI001CB8CEEA|nr:UDP-glycosyltransferase 75C1-like [Erigeron canadensis]
MTCHRKILIVAYPGQGHINPSLSLANSLVKMGVDVTFCTSVFIIKRIDKETIPHGLTFASFSDGHDNGKQPTTTMQQYTSDIATNGAVAVAEIMTSAAAASKPFDHLVYTTVLNWAARVANEQGVKSTLMWCQPATVMAIYYYYFNGYDGLISGNKNNITFPINLPGLPTFIMADLPSFFLLPNSEENDFLLELTKNHLDLLKVSPRLLVNTFDELEIESIKAMTKLEFVAIGPLTPTEFFYKPRADCIQWLNTKEQSSVVYVSFGTIASLSIDQLDEIAKGLLESGMPFLWVIRDSNQAEKLNKIEDLRKQGMIVDWCSQMEVLSHQAIGCFVMHGGWNSTLEALVAGVPLMVFPQWLDQETNGKMIEDVWKTGVRMRRRDRDGVVEGMEIVRCVKMVMGNEEMRRNAQKWRELSKKAVSHGGSSITNLQAFLAHA